MLKNQKGFTIVELAIVFVVIGILLAMALKARNFVNSARIVKESQRIANMENAYYKYMADTGHEYRKQPGLDIDMSAFADFISDDDRAGVFNTDALWSFTWCRSDMISDYATQEMGSSQVCVALKDKGGSIVTVPMDVACYMEIQVDDKFFKSGEGRVLDGSSLAADLQGELDAPICIRNVNENVKYVWAATRNKRQ